MRIGVIADTHVPARASAIPREVLDGIAGVDLILHAGDLVTPQVLDLLESVAPVEAVAGNNDPPELHERLGLVREITVGGVRIGITHGHLGHARRTVERALAAFSGVDCVVFGHSHQACCQWVGSTLAFNPGSATDRRRAPARSYGILQIGPGGISGKIHYLKGK